MKKLEYPLLDIDDDGYASLGLDTGDTKNDLKFEEGEEELLAQARAYLADDNKETVVTVISAVGLEKIVDCRAK